MKLFIYLYKFTIDRTHGDRKYFVKKNIETIHVCAYFDKAFKY